MAVTRFALTVATIASLASPAGAQPSKPDDKPDYDTAKLRYKQGKAFLDAKLYDDAIREFEAAYQIAPVPELLFNIAQADRLKGDSARAIEMYRRYVEQAPAGPGADEARRHIAALTKLLREPPPPKQSWRDDDDDKPPAPSAPPAAPPTVQPMPEASHVDSPAAHQRAIGRYVIYGGVAMGAVMGAFLYLGSHENDRIRNGRAATADDLRNAESVGSAYN